MTTHLLAFALGFIMLAVPMGLTAESPALQKPTAKPKAAAPKSSTAKAQAKTPATAANKSSPSSAKAILFAVSQRDSTATLDPIVILQNGKYNNPPGGDATLPQVTRFANQYYRAGAKYRLLFGGAETGTVEVKQWNLRKDCSRTEAVIKISGTDKIKGRVMGLATDAAELGRNSPSRRQPTSKERQAVEELARNLYRQKGISEAQLKDGFKYINETATDLNGDGKAELVATFLVKRTKGTNAAHVLFLIAELQGGIYKAAISQYGRITAADLGGSEDKLDDLGKNTLPEVLVDQIDLDRDGIAEVIIADLTEQGVIYKIYQKQKQGWRRAYEFSTSRCAP